MHRTEVQIQHLRITVQFFVVVVDHSAYISSMSLNFLMLNSQLDPAVTDEKQEKSFL